ncbi:MAG: hypothetical protein ACXWVS_10345 [Hyphomicrobium sp.]
MRKPTRVITEAPHTEFTIIFLHQDLSSITRESLTATAVNAMKTASENHGAD